MPDSRTEAVTAMVASSPIFPPSFDGSPWLFGAALFARALIFILAVATVVKLVSKTRAERPPLDSPAFYARTMVVCLLVSTASASLSDVSSWVAWGEVEGSTMSMIMATSRLLDGFSVVPFVLALFVPFWMYYARQWGVLRVRPPSPRSLLQDSRLTWGQVGIPLGLVGWCAVCAAGVTVGKWYAWYNLHVGG